jgi:hypothetical protein
MKASQKHLRAAACAAIFGSCGVALHAAAQILPPLPDFSPPSVSITAPASGATVSGTITVTASASDNRGVAGVQFRLDGTNGGAEDTAAPYSISWDTTGAANGSHTLTAVARDAAGNTTTSAPVTVTVANSPPPPPPPSTTSRYEESDAAVGFGAGWMPDNGWFAWSGGGAMGSMTPGARATFNFSGNSVTWLGMRGPDSGIARVHLDGALYATVDMFARSYEVHVPVFAAKGLPDGEHVLEIEATGLKSSDPEAAASPYAMVMVDAFDVPPPVVSQLQDTDADMSYTGSWTTFDTSRSWSGWYASVSSSPGARATLPFTGTGISWIGYRGPDAGIARVYVDGAFAGEVDLYSPDVNVQAVVFTSAPLADINHTLSIEATGLKNTSSSAARVVVDAFAVTAPGKRYEETEPAVAYAGNWTHGNLNRAWSMGSVAVANAAGAQATFTFTGTSVSWISTKKSTTGIARVYLDGAFVAEIDTYAPTDGLQKSVFRAAGLANAPHTLTIQATGLKNPASSNFYIVVDAFDVRP